MAIKGICVLSIVPVRAEPSDKAELVNQLLFGDQYELLQKTENGKWAKIKTIFDGYEGWIDFKQHTEIPDFFPESNQVINSDYVNFVGRSDINFPIPLGASFFYTGESMLVNQQEYQTHRKITKKEISIPEDLLKLSFLYLNSPYLWGGKTPFGIDCSGFTQQVFRFGGYKLKRDAWQQEQQGVLVANLEKTKPGDLAFFKNAEGRIIHVGIVLADKKIIHASGRVRIDELDTKGILNKESGEYTHLLASIKRLTT